MLSKLYIKEGLDTPRIEFDPAGTLSIEGKSYPPDVMQFFAPVLDWLKEYSQNPAPKTIVNLKLEYFNTASSKIIMDILYMFENIYKAGHDVLVKWYYPEDDEDMHETGMEYSEILELPFELIGYNFIIEEDE